GKNFKKVTKGLPDCKLGRIGLDWYRKDPKVVYAVVDCEKIGMGPPPVWVGLGADKPDGPAKVTRAPAEGPAAKAGVKVGDVITAIDKKPIKKWAEVGDAVLEHRAGDKITLAVQRDKETKDIVVTLEERPDPGAA